VTVLKICVNVGEGKGVGVLVGEKNGIGILLMGDRILSNSPGTKLGANLTVPTIAKTRINNTTKTAASNLPLFRLFRFGLNTGASFRGASLFTSDFIFARGCDSFAIGLSLDSSEDSEGGAGIT
jgi:hypothetical protein